MSFYYVYMIEAEMRDHKSKYFGLRKVLYTGQTNNIARRTCEHLLGKGSGFLKSNFSGSTKRLVYVQYAGSRREAMGIERQLKAVGTVKRRALILSDKNVLIAYVPFKAVVLRKVDGSGDVCLRLENYLPLKSLILA